MHIELGLGTSKLTRSLDICVDSRCSLVLALPAINQFGLVRCKHLRIASRCPQSSVGLRVLTLLAALEVDLAGGNLRRHVPLSDLSHSLSAVEAATHSSQVIIVNDLVSLRMRYPRIIGIVESLSEIAIGFHGVSIQVLIVIEGAATLWMLRCTAHDDP